MADVDGSRRKNIPERLRAQGAFPSSEALRHGRSGTVHALAGAWTTPFAHLQKNIYEIVKYNLLN